MQNDEDADMDKENLINELTLGLIDDVNIKASELKQTIEHILSDYSVTKMITTLPSVGDGQASMYLFSEFSKAKIAEGLRPNSLKAYERSLDVFYSYVHKEFNMVTETDVINFLDYYRLSGQHGERKPNTVRNMYLNLSTFFVWLFNHKYIAENIMANIKTPKGQVPNKKIVSESEIEKMIISCDDNSPLLKARNIALLHFLKDSGVRVSEFCNLNLSDIDMQNRIVYVKCGKGGKDRETTFSEKTKERLIEYLSKRPDIRIVDGNILADVDTPLFANRSKKTKRMTPSGVRYALKNMNHRVYPHLLRATCCTNLIMKGTVPVVVQSMMGHASMDMTNRYTKIGNDELREAMKHAI